MPKKSRRTTPRKTFQTTSDVLRENTTHDKITWSRKKNTMLNAPRITSAEAQKKTDFAKKCQRGKQLRLESKMCELQYNAGR